MRTDYVIRRVLMLIPTLLAIYTLTFFLMHSTPGGPWDNSDKPIPATVQEQLKKAYGLDKPVWQQYVDFLGKALKGDLGPSYTQRSRTVTDIIRAAFPVSLKLAAVAMAIAIVVGLPLGVIGAVRHNTFLDYVSTLISIIGISTPAYVATSLLVLLLASKLHWVPTGGWDGVFSKKVIVPAIALALYPTAVLARYTRSSMLDVLRQDYVRTARAKGIAERLVLLGHCLKNALLPVVTIAGIVVADIATGAFFVETIYQIPGEGRYFVQAISGRDYPVILGTTLVLGATVSIMNLIVDLLYPLLDPRIGAT
ncbi:MAG TPA: ABC transporter permease [Thermomicrobiales bacterium]|jgi:ABC-type dipeptide/oligopeptide/nickel transport system permease component